MSDVIETDRPGWSNVVGFTRYLVGQASDPPDRRELRPPAVVADGRLRLLVGDLPTPGGYLAAAEALSAETCERCGGKGDPIGDADGCCVGCRCARCRDVAAVRLGRPDRRRRRLLRRVPLRPLPRRRRRPLAARLGPSDRRGRCLDGR